MKNFFKSVAFIVIFVILFYALSFLVTPKFQEKLGLKNVAEYEALGETPNSLDILFVGDSLTYSSFSPITIYEEYGYTSYDVAHSGIIMQELKKYLKDVLEQQKPKIIFIEGNMIFRDWWKKLNPTDPSKKFEKNMENAFPLITYHNNWKNYFSGFTSLNHKVDYEKGMYISYDIDGGRNYNYMNRKDNSTIPKGNLELINEIIEIAKKSGARVILLAAPSQKTWSNRRIKMITEIANNHGIELLDLNHQDLNLNWVLETRDKGDHVNYYGAIKASKFIGKYLYENADLKDHRGEKGYEEWDVALKVFKNSNPKQQLQ